MSKLFTNGFGVSCTVFVLSNTGFQAWCTGADMIVGDTPASILVTDDQRKSVLSIFRNYGGQSLGEFTGCVAIVRQHVEGWARDSFELFVAESLPVRARALAIRRLLAYMAVDHKSAAEAAAGEFAKEATGT